MGIKATDGGAIITVLGMGFDVLSVTALGIYSLPRSRPVEFGDNMVSV